MENKGYVTHEECYNHRKDIVDQLSKTENNLNAIDKRVVAAETIVGRIDKALWLIVSAVITQTVALVFTLVKMLIV